MNKHFFTSIYSLYILLLFNLPTTSSNINTFSPSKYTPSTNSPVLKMTMYDYGFPSSSFNTTFINSDIKQVNLLEDTEGKIAYIDSEESFKNLVTINRVYNKRWYFYITTSENFNFILNQTNQNEFYTLGILLKEDLISQLNDSIVKSTIIPLINISNNNHTALISYDYKNQTYNTFFTFAQYREIKEYPQKYFLTVSILSFLLCCGFFIIWYIRFKKLDSNHVLLLQRILIILPIAELLVNLAILLEIILVNSNSSSGSSYQIYIETALITLNAVFRTVLWFMLVLVISGWQIIKQSLNREEMKFFIKVFILIYIVMCIDQIIDSVFIKVINLSASEIKNFVFYVFILYWLSKKGIKSYKYLQRKLSYARVVSREYIPSLLLKMKMVR